MRKYKINRTEEVKLPSKETIAKHKDFTNLWHEYDRYTKRPKVPLYRDKKMFFFLLLIALMTILIAQAMKEEEEEKKKNEINTESVYQQWNELEDNSEDAS